MTAKKSFLVLLGASWAAVLAACGARAERQPSGAEPRPTPGSSAKLDPVAGVDSPELRALLAEAWQQQLERSPVFATSVGDHRHDDRLRDFSTTGEAKRQAQRDDELRRARAIDEVALSARDRMTRRLFIESDEDDQGEDVCHWPEWDQSAYSSTVSQLEGLEHSHPLTSAASADAYLARVRAVPAALDQIGEQMRAGVASGRVAGRETLRRFVERLDATIAKPAAEWPYARAPRAAKLAPGVRDPLVAAVDVEVDQHIKAAYQRLRDLVENDVLPHGRDVEGLSGLPEGAACYRAAIRSETGLDLDPAELHQFGLDEVARVDHEMLEVGGRLWGVKSLAELRAHLASDRSLYFTSEQEILDTARAAIDRSRVKMAPLFASIPTAPLVIEPFPPEDATYAGTGQYSPAAPDGSRPARILLVTQPPERQGRWQLEVTAFHEGIPGHHLQLSRQAALGELPAFRRLDGNNAYIEGWGLYTERLCKEQGLYSDDVAWLGALSLDALRASRLVVDTGLHARGWTRAQAEAFLQEHTLETPEFIRNEVERYIVWPAQALAYKVGQRELLRLRDRASTALGDRFSLRDFHERVLSQGAVPLPVLDEIIDQWIAEQPSSKPQH